MTSPVTTDALVDQIARILDPDAHRLGRQDYYGPEPILAGASARVRVARKAAVAIIAGPLAPLLAAHQQVTAERDEYAEALMKVAEVGGWQASAGLAAQVQSALARLRAEGEAKDRALKPFADFSARHISADGHWWVTKAHTKIVSATFRSEDFNAARTALARAATAREGA